MARPFAAARIGELLWPEAVVVPIGVLCFHLLARGVDAAWGLEKPFRRFSDIAHAGIMGGSAYCVATDRAPEISKAAFLINGGVITARIGDAVYEKAVVPRVGKVRARKEAEKIAKEAGRQRELAARGGGGGGGSSQSERTRLMLEAAKEKAGGGGQPSGGGQLAGVGAGLGSGLAMLE